MALPSGPRARESIARQIAHLTRLIDDLLDLTRITRNKLQLQLRDVELQALIHDAVDSLTGATGATGHQIELRLPEEPTWLHADHDRLIQVLTNILGNAQRYSHAGSTIVLGAERAGSHVEIYVRDSGIGIAADDLPRVFDMFVQVGEGSHGGLGIGLALVKGLVDLHGGTIEARSEGIGRGAEFRMRLPRVSAPVSRDAGPESKRALAPHRILVVDDNRDAADSLGDWLLAHGHTVEVCYTAEDALQCAARLKPHVGLLDIGLPGMTGYDLAKRLRAGSPDGRVLLIAITGWGQQDDRERALEAGFDAHLTKPADPGQIIELIAEKSRATTPAL
jgi:CheY-like chemotaxis protein